MAVKLVITFRTATESVMLVEAIDATAAAILIHAMTVRCLLPGAHTVSIIVPTVCRGAPKPQGVPKDAMRDFISIMTTERQDILVLIVLKSVNLATTSLTVLYVKQGYFNETYTLSANAMNNNCVLPL